MIEPSDRNWGTHADWSRLPRIEPRIPALLAHFREHLSERELLVLDERRLTYGGLEASSAVLARQLLAFGIGKGSRIGLMLPTDETFLVTWMAVARIGAVAVSLPTLSTPTEIQKIARHSDLHILFSPQRYLHHDYIARVEAAFPGIAARRVPYRIAEAPYLRAIWLWKSDADSGPEIPAWAGQVDLSREPAVDRALLAAVEAEVHSSDAAAIIYTSGSTAEPKGVIHSQGSFIRAGMKLAASFKYQNDERAYAPMPFFWVGGLTTTAMCCMCLGAKMLASARSGAALLDFLERERATTVVAWPHILRALASDPTFPQRDWSAMRDGLLYEALPPEKRPADPTLMTVPLGMTETNGPYTITQRNLPEDQRGSVGPLMRGIEARLVDPESGAVLARWADGDDEADSGGQIGVMQVRGDVLMLGMVKREHADVFTTDGWYHTGDLCSYRRGHLHFHGRADDLIKASGANVSPREVEAVLLEIPGVASANVSGVPDPTRGNVVGALIVAQPGATLDAGVIRREAAKSLSSYKVPRVIVILEASQVPVMSSSKVDRRALVKLLHEAHDPSQSGR
jgi:acyl-CoA synthetase (AMP-forming)/AMP-acid ligase II